MGLHGPVIRAAYTMQASLPSPTPVPVVSRNVLIAGGVLALHVAALWALQSGLVRRAVEVVVPVQILGAMVNPPAPPAVEPAPVQQPQPLPPNPAPRVAPAPKPKPKPAVRQAVPVAPREPAPAPQAVTAAPAEPVAPPAPAAVAAAPAPAPAVPAPPAPAPVRLPSTDADYLNNPLPAYPAMSRRLREEGTSVVRVLIGVDGHAQEARIARSSGFERLDQAALATARGWRYVPGTRGGVPEAMWFEVPIRWQLNKE